MKISACLIVKNEKDHIQDVLSSLAGFDEIVVLDTGSTDNTVEIAVNIPNTKVYTYYEWNDDFAEARNHALSKCTGEWVLSIDGDEVLEEGGLEKIRKTIENATAERLHFSVLMTHKGSRQQHDLPRLFRNDGSVKWVGAAHETLSPVQKNMTDIVIEYGYSTAHQLDPDRMMRILAKVVNSPEATPRDMYYYAREFWYRKDYPQALRLFREYIMFATWLPEKADAMLYEARCLFLLQRGNEAREVCSELVLLNPMFKEALLFMAELHFEPWKSKWKKLAEACDNSDVLFKRV
jgi:glycosyltransferase involved in cell wall biosynthesis